MSHEPQLVRHTMTWWDAFAVGYGLALGVILAHVSILGTAGILVLVLVSVSR